MDAGEDWLIFALPPTEVAFHPADGHKLQRHDGRDLFGAVLYLICDDLTATMKSLQSRKVACSAGEGEPWGIETTIRLPSGGEIGLYQAMHPTAIELGGK